MPETKTWCCPFFDSVIVNKYVLLFDEGNERVMCSNQYVNVRFLLADPKGSLMWNFFSLIRRMTQNNTVTLFDPTLVDVIDINKEESETEDDLLPVKGHNIS